MYKALEGSIRSSEKHAELSDFAYRVWAQGLAVSDMVGRITANPRKFHAEAIPLLDYVEGKLLAAFNELKATGLCHFYDAGGKPYMVFHDHDEHNKGSKNLRHPPKSKVPPPPPSLCFCVTYQPHEDGAVPAGCKSLVRREEELDEEGVPTAVGTAVPTADATAVVHVPVHVPVLVLDSSGDGGVEEGEKWPPMPATTRGHLWRLFTKAHIQGTPSQKRQWFEGWLAQAGPERFEQILMERRIVGKDGFMIQKWYFNDMLKEAK